LHGNSVKAYDKAFTVVGNVLPVETTVNQPADFRVYRPKKAGPEDWGRPIGHRRPTHPAA
jgi:hypothetical protein